jgi:hypothetical protein
MYNNDLLNTRIRDTSKSHERVLNELEINLFSLQLVYFLIETQVTFYALVSVDNSPLIGHFRNRGQRTAESGLWTFKQRGHVKTYFFLNLIAYFLKMNLVLEKLKYKLLILISLSFMSVIISTLIKNEWVKAISHQIWDTFIFQSPWKFEKYILPDCRIAFVF